MLYNEGMARTYRNEIRHPHRKEGKDARKETTGKARREARLAIREGREVNRTPARTEGWLTH